MPTLIGSDLSSPRQGHKAKRTSFTPEHDRFINEHVAQGFRFVDIHSRFVVAFPEMSHLKYNAVIQHHSRGSNEALKKGRWEKCEDENLVEILKRHPEVCSYGALAKLIPNRSDFSIRQHVEKVGTWEMLNRLKLLKSFMRASKK